MAKKPDRKPSYRIYQIVMAALALITILSMIALAIRF